MMRCRVELTESRATHRINAPSWRFRCVSPFLGSARLQAGEEMGKLVRMKQQAVETEDFDVSFSLSCVHSEFCLLKCDSFTRLDN
jgi:hypothetical protein